MEFLGLLNQRLVINPLLLGGIEGILFVLELTLEPAQDLQVA